MRRIVFHIDRLVLRGVPRGDAAAVAEGLRTELQSLLAGDAAVAALSEHRSSGVVRAGAVRVPHGASGHVVGRAIAGHLAGRAKP